MLTLIVTGWGELYRIALTGEDRDARHLVNVTDDVLQLEVHLGERLLHVLDMLAHIGEAHGALAQVTVQYADLFGGPKGTGR